MASGSQNVKVGFIHLISLFLFERQREKEGMPPPHYLVVQFPNAWDPGTQFRPSVWVAETQ